MTRAFDGQMNTYELQKRDLYMTPLEKKVALKVSTQSLMEFKERAYSLQMKKSFPRNNAETFQYCH